jgi:DNA-directed RNA polymerase specialized sigma24 family protein
MDRDKQQEERQRYNRLHARLISGDPTASSDIFEVLSPPLIRLIRAKSYTLSVTSEDAIDVATDAIVQYIICPQKYNPEKASLLTFLNLIAQRDLIDLHRKKINQQQKIKQFVELEKSESNNLDIEEVFNTLTAEQVIQKYGYEIAKTEEEEAALKLYLEGEQDIEPYAKALKLYEQNDSEIRKTVKQCKDRFDKRMSRLGEKLVK